MPVGPAVRCGVAALLAGALTGVSEYPEYMGRVSDASVRVEAFLLAAVSGLGGFAMGAGVLKVMNAIATSARTQSAEKPMRSGFFIGW